MDLSGTRVDIAKNVHLHVLEFPMSNRLPIPSCGDLPLRVGMPTSGELALRPYCPILRFVDRLRPLRRSITVRMRSK